MVCAIVRVVVNLTVTAAIARLCSVTWLAHWFRHEVIKTTVPKAKELRRVIEPLITLAKQDSVANRRLAFARTRDKEVVGKLFNELGPRFAERAGGYTRILKCGFRAGDNAPMAFIELV